jgi:hypothetical protein
VLRGPLYKKRRIMLRGALHVTMMSNVSGSINQHPCCRHAPSKPLAPHLVDCPRHRPYMSSEIELVCNFYSRTAQRKPFRKPRIFATLKRYGNREGRGRYLVLIYPLRLAFTNACAASTEMFNLSAISWTDRLGTIVDTSPSDRFSSYSGTSTSRANSGSTLAKGIGQL